MTEPWRSLAQPGIPPLDDPWGSLESSALAREKLGGKKPHFFRGRVVSFPH
jgi:hypothetical protein